jgi:N-acetylglucosaminyl-diphospho-decaprenol L-rhamnosyltransferase
VSYPTATSDRVGCVIVDFSAGHHLVEAVDSMLESGVAQLVVVDNAGSDASRTALGDRLDAVVLVEPGRNVGFGAGVNRGVAAFDTPLELLLVANPDVVLHAGALDTMVAALDARPTWGIVGPTILDERGSRYPSVRSFPTMPDAVGHASLGRVWPTNPYTRRYRESGSAPDGTADWVSGSCFLIRRELFEQLGGFDERYFMFAEDMDLCWRARLAGVEVGTAQDAVVTHVEGVSRRVAPLRMKVAHHRSAFRFAVTTSSGPSRLLLPFAALLLGARLIVTLAMIATASARSTRAG